MAKPRSREAMLAVKQAYECLANTHDESMSMVKQAYERLSNGRGEATRRVKLDTRGEVSV